MYTDVSVVSLVRDDITFTSLAPCLSHCSFRYIFALPPGWLGGHTEYRHSKHISLTFSIKETFMYVRDWHFINLSLIYATTWDTRVVSRVRVTTALSHAPTCNLPLIYARPSLLGLHRVVSVMPQLAPNLCKPPSFVF